MATILNKIKNKQQTGGGYMGNIDERLLNYMSKGQLKDIIKELLSEIERLEANQQESTNDTDKLTFTMFSRPRGFK